MPIKRGLKIWFFTNLLGTVLLLFLSSERGPMEPALPLVLYGFSSLFSLPAIFISAGSIHILKKLPQGYVSRAAFVFGSTVFTIGAVLAFFESWFGFGLGIMGLIYPYCIAAIIITFFFTRDLILASKQEETIRIKEITGYEQE
jgi:hypothetical protein